MGKKPIKQRLKDGEFVIGTWCLIPSLQVTNILANSGLDFLIIDMEHGPIDFTKASEMITAAEGKCEIVVRVADNRKDLIQQALDSGAAGVLVPHVDTAEERASAISCAKYPPEGTRGFSPFTKAGGYAIAQAGTAKANESTLTGVMAEGKKGLANLDAILDERELDLVYVGTYDISASFGIAGQVESKKVTDALEKAVKQIRAKGKVAGCMANDAAGLKKLKALGVQLLLYKVDTSLLLDSAKGISEEMKKA
jgi:4-hydroxy-2-oxoheptanedioate aldolase